MHFLLAFYLQEFGTLTLDNVRICIAELFQALKFLHERKICHRDIKPENVLICNDGHIALTDFGLTVEIENSELLYHRCGTYHYIAPGNVNSFRFFTNC